jgi:hypothetical protein
MSTVQELMPVEADQISKQLERIESLILVDYNLSKAIEAAQKLVFMLSSAAWRVG